MDSPCGRESAVFPYYIAKGSVLLGGNCPGVSRDSLSSKYACTGMLFAFAENGLVAGAGVILNFVI